MFTKRAFPHLPKDLIADNTVQFIGEVYIGESCEFGENCIVDASSFRITINSNCKIGTGTKIIADTEKIEIGPDVIIGENCIISVSVSKNSVIADNQTLLKSYN